MWIQSETKGAVSVVFGIARRVKDSVARPEGPVVARRPGYTHSGREFLVISILDCAKVLDVPAERRVALSAEKDSSCAT